MDDLIATLRQAHEDTCSLHCPSVWKTADGRPPHSERCQAVEAAIGQVKRLKEDNAALRREIEANVIEGIAAHDLQQYAERMAEAIKEYFNRRGVAHADRKGNEYIAEMADALCDYGLAINIAKRDSL